MAVVDIDRFGGLNLRGAPDESDCVDLLNIDFQRQGRMGSRSGYAKFNSVANANAITGVAVHYRSGAADQILIADTGNRLRAYDNTGALSVTSTATAATDFLTARFGTDASERTYIATGGERLWRWDGTAFALLGAGPTPTAGLATTSDNRLVYISTNGETSRVEFSDAGAPETVGANNWVRLHPGDGETLTGGCAWRELTFIFKPNKFFVFTGNATDASGNPVFDYRVVETGVGAGAPGAARDSGARLVCPTPHGLCFIHQTGVYITTGGPPQSLSDDISPLFRGDLPGFFTGQARSFYADDIAKANLTYWRNRLVVSIPDSTGTTVSKTLVYDFEQKAWSFWDLPARQLAPMDEGTGGVLLFTTPTSHAKAVHILNHGNPVYAQTTDDGTAITSRYRSGFHHLAGGADARVREIILNGTGTVTVKTSVDWGALDTGGSVTMGTSPAIAEARYRGSAGASLRGANLSWQVSSTGTWSLQRAQVNVPDTRAFR